MCGKELILYGLLPETPKACRNSSEEARTGELLRDGKPKAHLPFSAACEQAYMSDGPVVKRGIEFGVFVKGVS